MTQAADSETVEIDKASFTQLQNLIAELEQSGQQLGEMVTANNEVIQG